MMEVEARLLVGYAAEIKPRYRATIKSMLDGGSAWQAAWPLLCAAVLGAPGDELGTAAARGRILRALGLEGEREVGARLAAAEEGVAALRDAAEERVGRGELDARSSAPADVR